jgi:hypothetical protein
VDLLSRVDQKEEHRERTRGGGGDLERERVDLAQQLLQGGRGRIAPATGSAGDAQLFDGTKHRITLQALDHSPEQAREPSHVVLQSAVFRAWVGGFHEVGCRTDPTSAARPAAPCTAGFTDRNPGDAEPLQFRGCAETRTIVPPCRRQ